MQRQYWQVYPVTTAAFRGNTGDGIRMALDLGADLWHMWHYHGSYGFRHPDPAYPFSIRVKRLPVDGLKIDKSFVLDMFSNKDSLSIVRSAIDLAHDLDLKVVAEGVEYQASWEQLITLGCDVAQGYLISHPLSGREFEKWLHSHGHGGDQTTLPRKPLTSDM